jgi:hypothetical protein
MAPTWVTILTAVLVALLPVGGAAFLVDNSVLTALLTASLLLLWVAAVGRGDGRGCRRIQGNGRLTDLRNDGRVEADQLRH